MRVQFLAYNPERTSCNFNIAGLSTARKIRCNLVSPNRMCVYKRISALIIIARPAIYAENYI